MNEYSPFIIKIACGPIIISITLLGCATIAIFSCIIMMWGEIVVYSRRDREWCLWCNSSTSACGAGSSGAGPDRHPSKNLIPDDRPEVKREVWYVKGILFTCKG